MNKKVLFPFTQYFCGYFRIFFNICMWKVALKLWIPSGWGGIAQWFNGINKFARIFGLGNFKMYFGYFKDAKLSV